jgi:hypothetical protein
MNVRIELIDFLEKEIMFCNPCICPSFRKDHDPTFHHFLEDIAYAPLYIRRLVTCNDLTIFKLDVAQSYVFFRSGIASLRLVFF